MRRLIGGVIGVLAGAGPALADCAGEDLLARLAAERPAEHAAILEAAAEVPNGEGRLWRVGRDGIAPSHLFATYHDTRAIETMGPAETAAFEAAERLVVEIDGAEMEKLNARIATDPGFVFAAEGAGIAARLDPEELARAEAVLEARGLSVEVAERMQPWMFFSVMGIPACEIEEIAGGALVMDRALIERAEKMGKPVLGLEGYEAALGVFGELDPEVAAAMASDMLRLAEREEDLRATLFGLYREGRLGAIDAFSDWLTTQATGRVPAEVEDLSEAFETAVLEDRNRGWMARLVPALEQGGAFVAVGGLHLPGEAGLVALLRDAGFTVTPVGG